MSAKLVAEEGNLKGLVLSLEGGEEWVIGRDPDTCQLLVEDPSASRKHLLLKTSPDGIVVENLSQTNPTEVNEEEVKEPRLLHNGDSVKIGDGVFRFYADAAAQLFKESGTTLDEPVITRQDPITHNGEPKTSTENLMEKQIATPTTEGHDPEIDKKIETALDEADKEPSILEHSEEEKHDTIYEDQPSDKGILAEINFGLLDTGRWLLKVVSGPNNGAEFSMQTGSSYIVGTDPNTCDIVFHDTSVSRQHARLSVGQDETIQIEDLKSRNGTIVDGEPLTGKRSLPTNVIVSLGTTSFVVFDREGEMHTIISPLMPQIVKVLQKVDEKAQAAPPPVEAATKEAAPPPPPPPPPPEPPKPDHHTTLGAFILMGILVGVFIVVGIGTATLFKSEPVQVTEQINPTQTLDNDLSAFPSVKYSYNKTTGQLLLVGHVLTATDRSQLLYSLRGLPFIKNLDDSGLVVDEFVWRETNQVMEKNPEWRGITIISSEPGHFILTGYLNTRSQADRLAEYLGTNFPYPDLLENRIVIEEEVVSNAAHILQDHGLRTVKAKLDNGELILSGGIPQGKGDELNAAIAEIKGIRGVRSIQNNTSGLAGKEAFVNISDRYEVSGLSNHAGKLSVVINGRILTKGDTLDGMTITSIQPNSIRLEKDNTQYRIDFSQK